MNEKLSLMWKEVTKGYFKTSSHKFL